MIEYHPVQEVYQFFDGEIKLDEGYFSSVRKDGRSVVVVFGLLKHNGKAYTVAGDTKTLMPIITNKVKPGNIVYADSYHSYNALDISDFKHFRINHSKEFADHHNHIKTQENF